MPKFKAGDYIYSEDDQSYRVARILAVDSSETISGEVLGCYHIAIYQNTALPPSANSLDDLKLTIMHAPIDMAGIDGSSHLIVNVPVSKNDLEGYLVYLRDNDFGRYLDVSGEDVEQLIAEANAHYKNGCAAHDQGDLQGAIDAYTMAYTLFPLLFEAIDNKGFALMDMGKFKEAADVFRQSLQVNDEGSTALFSLGECMLKLNQLREALPCFEEGARRWPEIKEFQEFLTLTQGRLNA